MAILRNEQDVREEIATPFLKALGYESGTTNDIKREHRLRYAAMQLGRKKEGDVPVPQGGDADYLLTVSGVGRWVLETKPPDQEITADDIDQAISYARHPEVSGHYAAVLNGSRFVLYFSTQTSNDQPIVDTQLTSGKDLAAALEGLLSPLAIRRDCNPPVVDLRAPLAPGFRGEAAILGGWNKQIEITLETQLPIPPAVLDELRAQYSKLIGTQSTVISGKIWRDGASRIRARLSWNPLHEKMKPLLEAARLDEFEYVCLDTVISTDPSRPSVFDILAAYHLKEGQPIYDLVNWQTKVLNVDARFVIQGQASGFLSDNEFRGLASFHSVATVRNVALPLVTSFLTEFCFKVDPR